MALRGWYRTALGALLLLVVGIAEAQTAACPNGILSYRRSGAGQFSSANLCPTNAQPEEFRSCIETWANLPANSNRFGSRGPVTIRNAAGFASSGSLEIWAFDFNSTQGTTANYSFLNITVNCGTCPAGSSRNPTTGQCQVTPPACESGTTKHSGTLYQNTATVQDFCAGGCVVTPSAPPAGICVEIGGASNAQNSCSFGNSSTLWTATGAACTSGSTQPSLPPVVTTASGETYTLQPQGCGLVNGESFCASDAPPTPGCVTTAGGQLFCSSGTPTPPVPSAPGQPGTPATPSSSVTTVNNNTSTTVNHYNTTVVQAGQNGGTGGGGTGGGAAGGSTGGTTGGGGGGTAGGGTGGTGGVTGGGGDTGGQTGGNCGAPGEPKCEVKVDGTGIEEFSGGAFQEHPFGNPEAVVADTKAAAEAGGGDIAGAFDQFETMFTALLPPSTTCQSVTLTYFGVSRPLPGARGCELLEQFKSIANYIILVLTAAAILRKFVDIYATSKV